MTSPGMTGGAWMAYTDVRVVGTHMETEHGYSQYTHGCRCQVCRSAKAEYMRRRRAAARAVAGAHTQTASGRRASKFNAFAPGSSRYEASVERHGTRYAYEEKGCRCRSCTTARTISERKYLGRGPE